MIAIPKWVVTWPAILWLIFYIISQFLILGYCSKTDPILDYKKSFDSTKKLLYDK